MNEELKIRGVSIANKLYLTLSVIVLIATVLISYKEIEKQQQITLHFENAHSELEQALKYNPAKSGEDLDESRLVMAADTLIRESLSDQDPDGFKMTLQEHAMISACFNYYGNYLGDKDNCSFRIYDFKPGKTYRVFFQQLAILLCVALGLFLLRKWFIWLVAKPKVITSSN